MLLQVLGIDLVRDHLEPHLPLVEAISAQKQIGHPSISRGLGILLEIVIKQDKVASSRHNRKTLLVKLFINKSRPTNNLTFRQPIVCLLAFRSLPSLNLIKLDHQMAMASKPRVSLRTYLLSRINLIGRV